MFRFIYITMKKNSLFRVIEEYISEKEFSMIYKNNNLNVINYTKILDFSSTTISFCDNRHTYHVEGSNLVISKMFEDEILITGNIEKIIFI